MTVFVLEWVDIAQTRASVFKTFEGAKNAVKYLFDAYDVHVDFERDYQVHYVFFNKDEDKYACECWIYEAELED